MPQPPFVGGGEHVVADIAECQIHASCWDGSKPRPCKGKLAKHGSTSGA